MLNNTMKSTVSTLALLGLLLTNFSLQAMEEENPTRACKGLPRLPPEVWLSIKLALPLENSAPIERVCKKLKATPQERKYIFQTRFKKEVNRSQLTYEPDVASWENLLRLQRYLRKAIRANETPNPLHVSGLIQNSFTPESYTQTLLLDLFNLRKEKDFEFKQAALSNNHNRVDHFLRNCPVTHGKIFNLWEDKPNPKDAASINALSQRLMTDPQPESGWKSSMSILFLTLPILREEALTKPPSERHLIQRAILLTHLQEYATESGFGISHAKECIPGVTLYKIWNFLQDDSKPVLDRRP